MSATAASPMSVFWNISTFNTTVNGNQTTELLPAGHGGSMVLGLLVLVVALIIFLGNLLILIVLKLYRPLTIPDVLVLSLALSDFLNVSFPVQILNVNQNILGKPYTVELCTVYVWATYTLRLASVMTVSIICIDRWIAILKPLYYRTKVMSEVSKVKIFILLVWLLGGLLALLPHIGVGSNGFIQGRCFYQLLNFGLGYGSFIVILGLSQLGIVLYCYISIKISTTSFLRRQSQMRVPDDRRSTSILTPASGKNGSKEHPSIMGKHSSVSQNSSVLSISTTSSSLIVDGHQKRSMTDGEKHVTTIERMMAAVVVLYYITWLPFLITNMFSLVTGKSNSMVVVVVGFFSLVNGLLNPIVYGTLNLRYRKGYTFIWQKIWSLCGGKQPVMTLEDFDETRRRHKKNLENIKKMRSISAHENLSQESKGYTWSTNSTQSTSSGPNDHGQNSLHLKEGLNLFNYESVRSHVFRIPIEEEKNSDIILGSGRTKALEVDLDLSFDESVMTEDTQIDANQEHEEVISKDSPIDDGKERIASHHKKLSPPVIMSYSLANSLDAYPDQFTVDEKHDNQKKRYGVTPQEQELRTEDMPMRSEGKSQATTGQKQRSPTELAEHDELVSMQEQAQEVIMGEKPIDNKQERDAVVSFLIDSKRADVSVSEGNRMQANPLLANNNHGTVDYTVHSGAPNMKHLLKDESLTKPLVKQPASLSHDHHEQLNRMDDLESTLDTSLCKKEDLTSSKDVKLKNEISFPQETNSLEKENLPRKEYGESDGEDLNRNINPVFSFTEWTDL